MVRRTALFLGFVCCCLSVFAEGVPEDIDLDFAEETFTVKTTHYKAVIDLGSGSISEIRIAGEEEGSWGSNLLGTGGISLSVDSATETYSSTNRSSGFAHAHVTRRGPYLVEVYVENILLADSGGTTWDGVGEYTLWFQKDRIGLRAAAIRSFDSSGYICRDPIYLGYTCCYPLAIVSTPGNGQQVVALGLDGDVSAGNYTLLDGVSVWGSDDLLAAMPENATGEYSYTPSASGFSYDRTPTPSDEGVQTMGVVFLLDGSQASLEARLSEQPLGGERFSATVGRTKGYKFLKGIYDIRGDYIEGGSTRGESGGAKFSIQNDLAQRTILIDQRASGWLRGALVRDGDGKPLSTFVQQNLNFPELMGYGQGYGEDGWGFLTYLVDLEPGETRSLHGEELYLGYGEEDQISLCWLENIGNPPLIQTSVAAVESHTVQIGEQDDLLFNDFRIYHGQWGLRSVTCVCPKFFRYRDNLGVWHSLKATSVQFLKIGPLLSDYTVTAKTANGKVEADLRLWQWASERTRVFAQAEIRVLEDLQLVV